MSPMKSVCLACLLCLIAAFITARTPQIDMSHATIETVRKYVDEKSYQLATEAADKLLNDKSLDKPAMRETTYLKGYSLKSLHRNPEAEKVLLSITQDKSDDIWAGRAHWQLQPWLDSSWYSSEATSDPLTHLRAADRILTGLNSPDRSELYHDVLFGNIILMNSDSTPGIDHGYLMQYFDKIIPLLKDNESKLAEIYTRRADVKHQYYKAPTSDEEYLKELRAVVTEFPKTRAAASAQLKIAQSYVDRRDFVPAVYELSLLVNQFAGTEEARNGAATLEKIKQSEVEFNLYQTYRPGEKIPITLMSRNADDVKMTATPFDPIGQLKAQNSTRIKLEKVIGKPTWSKRYPMDKRDDYLESTRSLELSFDEPGIYVLKAEVQGGGVCYRLLAVSTIALVAHQGAAGIEMWVVDSASGKPRQQTPVTIASDPKTENKWFSGEQVNYYTKFTSTTSDESGFANFNNGNSGSIFALASEGNNLAFLDTYYSLGYGQDQRDNPMVYAYTDRPVYRPGQQVNWRAILRTQSDGKYELPASGSRLNNVRVEINDPQGANVYKKSDQKPGAYGTISGDFTPQAGAPLGVYQIAFYAVSDGASLGNTSFRVEEYKKPEFEVSVEAANDLAKIGQTVAADVNATYLFGGPVSGGDVKYTVRRRPRYWLFPDYIRWYSEPDLGWFEQNKERPSDLHNSGGEIVASGTGKLDEDGKYKLKFEAKVPENELQGSPYPIYRRGFLSSGWGETFFPQEPSWDFQIEVTVTDKSRRNIDASQVIPVGKKALNLEARAPRQIVSPGDMARVEIKSMNLAQKPARTSGTLYVEKVEWNETLKEDKITTVSSSPLDTGSSGSIITDWRVPVSEAGQYRFAFIADDPFGGKSVAYAQFFIARPGQPDINVRYQGIQLVSDKNTYKVGETAQIMILNENPDTVAWYWIDAGSGNLEKKLIPLTQRTNFLPVTITDAFSPNVKVHVLALKNKQVIQDEIELVVPPLRNVMNVEITGESDPPRPGGESRISLRATDEKGLPVQAEFSLSMFDQAITYIAPDERDDIRRAFYGMRRQLNTQIVNSLGVAGNYQTRSPADGFGIYQGEWASTDNIDAKKSQSNAPPPAAMALRMADNFNGGLDESKSIASRRSLFSAGKPGQMKGEVSPAMMPAPPPAPTAVRSDFRDSMFWSPAVVTDAAGSATITVKWPDSLTTWKSVAIGIDHGARVGNVTSTTIVQKDLLARLEVPRFFREKDKVTVSGIVHNNFDSDVDVTAELKVSGITLIDASTSAPVKSDSTTATISSRIHVPAHGETRVDFPVEVDSTGGTAILEFSSLSSKESDALRLEIPVVAHGIDKFVAWNGSTSDEATTDATISTTGTATRIVQNVTFPSERIHSTSRLEILLTPSLARAVRDALPSMVDYPYGCVEQTMSRFMPAAVAASTFQKLGIPLDPLLKDKLPEVTRAGIQRLRDFQLPSGGWGWWAHDSENMSMTAYVIYGFTLARQADVSLPSEVFDRGLSRLKTLAIKSTTEQRKHKSDTGYWFNSNISDLACSEYVLSLNNASTTSGVELLWNQREKLSAAAQPMLAMTLWKSGRQEDARTVLRNMYNNVVITTENNTARWGLIDHSWYWWTDAVESTSLGLQAYLMIQPDDPIVAQAMKWLVLNRQGAQWKSTKDTARAVLALTDYMLKNHEAAGTRSIRVEAPGHPAWNLEITPQNFWDFDGRLTIEGSAIPDGTFPVTITTTGTGTLFYSMYASYFTKEDPITSAGNEIHVDRRYEKLVRRKAVGTEVTSRSVESVDTYIPLKEGESLKSGDELRVTLNIRSLNDYEYLVFEDYKPAGMEPVDLQSGSAYGNGLCSNMELRDQWVAFFITHLSQGDHQIQYNIRAEIPGVFHAMPTTGHAMYFPPLKTNADETILTVKD